MFRMFVFSLLCCFCSCKQNISEDHLQEFNRKAKTPAVSVQKMVVTNAPIPIDASGILGVRDILNLSFKTGGIIKAIEVKENQRVRKGQSLASIYSTEIDAQVVKAEEMLNKANRDFLKLQKMYGDTATTLENVENQKTLLDLAAADLEIAKFNQKQVTMLAPVSGRVLRKYYDEGELAGPGVPVIQLASNGEKGFVLRTSVADIDVVRLSLNDKAEVVFDAYPRQVFQAYVSDISEAADRQTGAFGIELALSSQAGFKLRSGFVGKVQLFPQKQKPYYKIEMDALVEGNEKQANIFLLKERSGKYFAQRARVYPEHIGADFFTASADQIEADQLVIIKGAAYLKEGAEVRLTNR